MGEVTTADVPFLRASTISWRVIPMGLTAPNPVITTRFIVSPPMFWIPHNAESLSTRHCTVLILNTQYLLSYTKNFFFFFDYQFFQNAVKTFPLRTPSSPARTT